MPAEDELVLDIKCREFIEEFACRSEEGQKPLSNLLILAIEVELLGCVSAL